MPLFMLKWFQDPSLMMQLDGGAAPKQKALRVLEAPEPTNILWENLEYTRFQRFCRRSLSFSFTILIIIISFAVIVWGKSFNESLNNTSKQCANATFTETCDLSLNWSQLFTFGCTSQTSCTLADIWGATNQTLRANTPLQLDTATMAAKILVGSGCRLNSTTADIINPSSLSTECSTAVSSISDVQWRALTNAQWLNVTSSTVSDCATCLCASAMASSSMLSLWYSSINLGFSSPKYTNADGKGFCSEQAVQELTRRGLQVGAIVVVVVFNKLMQISTQYLARFERHHTVAQQETSIANAVFYGQFLNTALVSLVVNAKFNFVKDSLPSDVRSWFPLFSGSYSDFEISWFDVVGTQLLVTIIVNIVLPSVPLATSIINKWLAPCFSIPILQRDLHQRYLQDEFLLSPRYGMLLNVLFCCYMYSAGIPILYLVGTLFFLAAMYLDRIQLLRYSKNPPQFDETLALNFLSALRYAVLLHLCFGCWIFSATNMFPRPSIFSSSSISGISSQNQTSSFEDRLLNRMLIAYTCFTVLMIVLTVLEHTPARPVLQLLWNNVIAFLLLLFNSISSLICRSPSSGQDPEKGEDGDRQDPPYLEALLGRHFGNFPSSYNLKKISEYEEVLNEDSGLVDSILPAAWVDPKVQDAMKRLEQDKRDAVDTL
mmetsp:Transcript_8073/g.27031  ORF Transcript_8073/g.27031 Transcript_8073/m.27031 type:complete len:660 (+) Transcript_8073:2010-3989(+)